MVQMTHPLIHFFINKPFAKKERRRKIKASKKKETIKQKIKLERKLRWRHGEKENERKKGKINVLIFPDEERNGGGGKINRKEKCFIKNSRKVMLFIYIFFISTSHCVPRLLDKSKNTPGLVVRTCV